MAGRVAQAEHGGDGAPALVVQPAQGGQVRRHVLPVPTGRVANELCARQGRWGSSSCPHLPIDGQRRKVCSLRGWNSIATLSACHLSLSPHSSGFHRPEAK